MAPLLALLCLLQLGPGRRLGKRGYWGSVGVAGAARSSQRVKGTTSTCPCLIWPVFPFAPVFPTPAGLADLSCSQNVNIDGGNFTLSHGWAPGSLLIYSCPLGRYPSPAWRQCQSNGVWHTPRSSSLPTLRSSRMVKAICKRESLWAMGFEECPPVSAQGFY